MKLKYHYCLCIMASLAILSRACAEDSFTETFAASSDTAPLSSIGWKANAGGAGTPLDSPDIKGGQVPFVANGRFLYYLLPALAGQSIFVWTDKVPSFGDIGRIRDVVFNLSNADAEDRLSLALRVGGRWFVSEESYGGAAKERFQVKPSALHWKSLEFVSGEKMNVLGAAELPQSGAVDGIGFYQAAHGAGSGGAQKVRIVSVSLSSEGEGAKSAAAPAKPAKGAPHPFGVTTLTPAAIKLNPSPKYWPRVRMWQGIPSIACTPAGRLWATWYAGPVGEGEEGNYSVLVTSGDGGKTWSRPVAVYDPTTFFDGNTGDPHLWVDSKGQLWWFVNRSLQVGDPNGHRSIWAFRAKDPEDPRTGWMDPIFAGFGVALNKSTVLSTGEWIRPVDTFNSKKPDNRTQFYRSLDEGKTYEYFSAVAIKDVVFPEHMVVEKKDGSLVVMARTTYGIGTAESFDKGKTWINEGPFTKEMNVNTRFYFGKLKSGNWLLVVNDVPKGRRNMTAMLSEDEGKSWPYKLVLDERDAVSYPDASEGPAGNIYIIHDRGRYLKDQQEILLSKVREADIKAGKLTSPGSYLKQIVSRLADEGGGVHIDRETQNMTKEYEGATESLKELEEKKQKGP
jgi:hypothetical protein